MSLQGRLSAFFLAALALVLLGFSAAMYLLARGYLYRQLDERLAGTLDMLAAAAEVGSDGVEWERPDHPISRRSAAGADGVRWAVRDGDGRLVEGSDASVLDELGRFLAAERSAAPAGIREVSVRGRAWHVGQRFLRPDRAAVPAAERAPSAGAADAGVRRYPTLLLTAAAPLDPLRARVHTLGWILLGLSAALWLLAAGLGRWLGRRALAPVGRMAEAARAMSPDDLAGRLPRPGTGDELDDLAGSFNGLLGRVQDAYERQRRFTGDASHQLRTPLAAMLGQTDVVLRRERSPAEYRQALERVQGEALRLRQVLEMLLFLARADAEAARPPMEAVELDRWLPEHLKNWEAHERAADLRVDVPPGGPFTVRAHAALLGQLVDNLLENACKYSERGTPVTVRLRGDGREAVLEVEDAGRGISAADLPHVFEPFYRSPDVRGRGYAGVGLGLAVARRIAGTFGGHLEADGRLDKGSRFTLRLPRANAGLESRL